MTTRREFLFAAAATAAAAGTGRGKPASAQDRPPVAGDRRALDRQVGITMSSLARLATDAGPEKISMLQWPKILRDEVDLRVIDLNSGVLPSLKPGDLEQVRAAADKAGCTLTNVKINRSDIDFGSDDAAIRRQALAECKRWIDAAAQLGLRWTRALPFKKRPDVAQYAAGLQELADYAADRRVQMLVENYGWMSSDADSAAQLIQTVGHGVAACPDTGNWDDKLVRYAGLEKLFPRAATCDFKAGKLGPGGEHPAWDLKRCFTIGWDAGFRGPWCLEHAGTDRQTLFRELGFLRDSLRRWMAERG